MIAPVVPILAMSDISASGGSGSGTAVTTKPSDGIKVTLVHAPTLQSTGMVSVSLPKGTATMGNGFSFLLPAEVGVGVANGTQIWVSRLSGAALPTWLNYIAGNRTIVGKSVPDGAFPMQLVVHVGSQQTVITISERTE